MSSCVLDCTVDLAATLSCIKPSQDVLPMGQEAVLHCRHRAELKTRFESGVFDLLIIGGGITGAGVARDAAMRGLRTALVEAQDFASGTSSRSSKMIHGGLRYLVQGDIPVVKESASERVTLARIAPHLAHKSDYIITTRSWKEELALRVALTVYEWLGKVSKDDRHRVWSKTELARREPALRLEGVRSAVVYPEYLTDDARLTLATVRSAAANGAVVGNYLKASAISRDGDFKVHCVSQLPEDDTEITIKAKLVINCAGPWADHLCQLENPAASSRLALSRGIHIVVPAHRLPVNNTVVMSTPDKRKIFAVPIGEFTYLGTTDEFYPACEYWPAVEAADLEYLFATTNRQFPDARLNADDVVSVWSGIRPLVGSTDDKATEISRKDEAWVGALGMLSIAGGKLSAYRAMAKRIVDQAVDLAGFDAGPCITDQHPLPGGTPFTHDTAPELEDGWRVRWSRLYGSELSDVVSYGHGMEAEVRYAVAVEGALRLEDYWARRSSRAWFDDRGGIDSLEPAAAVMAELLGWSTERMQTEIDHCLAIDRDSRSRFKPIENLT